MATHIFKLGAQGAGTDLGELALGYFKGMEIPISVPDAGATAEETLQRLLDACGGDHKNLRNVFVGQSARLTYQKAIKDEAKELAPRVRLFDRIAADANYTRTEDEAKLEPISLEDAKARLLEIASGIVPQHSVKGEGESKPRATSIKKAVDQERAAQAATTKKNLEAMPARQRAQAEALLKQINPDLYALITAQDEEEEDADEGDES